MIRFACPSCLHLDSLSEDAAGQKVQCPACGKRFRVPQVAGEVPIPWWRGVRPLAWAVLLLIFLVPGLGLIVVAAIGLSRSDVQTENRQGEGVKGEVVHLTLTEDQLVAWRKLRHDNQRKPVRVLGCLFVPDGSEDFWTFANQDRIFVSGRRAGEESFWARGVFLGEAYFSADFVGRFEDSEIYQRLTNEATERMNRVAESQRQEKENFRRSREAEERQRAEVKISIPAWMKKQEAESAEWLDDHLRQQRSQFVEQDRRTLAFEREVFEKHRFAAALRRAEQLAARREVKAMAVIDLFSEERPRILRWYWNDGSRTVSSEQAPRKERLYSLKAFLNHLIQNSSQL